MPNSYNMTPSFSKYKRIPIFLLGSGLGFSGVIGIFNKWLIFQYYVIIIIYILIFIFPYLVEIYKIYKNENPTENDKKRNHEKELKQMEYNFKLNMKQMETSEGKNNNDGLQMINEKNSK